MARRAELTEKNASGAASDATGKDVGLRLYHIFVLVILALVLFKTALHVV